MKSPCGQCGKVFACNAIQAGLLKRGCNVYCSKKCAKKHERLRHKELHKGVRRNKNKEKERKRHTERMEDPEYRERRRIQCSEGELRRISKRNNDTEYRRVYYAKRTEYKKEYGKTNVQFKIIEGLRTRVRSVLRGERKSAPTIALLGCTLEHFRQHIESQFKRGMTWENWGTKWHLDHKFPCSKHHLTDPAEQRRCFHWTNFQPLTAEENIRKGSRITEPQMSILFNA